MKLFFVAGEPSGDLHGANLIRALQQINPNVEIVGFGGPKMRAAGANLLYPLTELAVMGLQQIIGKLPQFVHLLDRAETDLRKNRPDAIVLIDYPGFNFALAKRAHALGIPIYYFVPPQIWGWRTGRVRQVRKWCAGVLTALPFEEDWYRSRGVKTHYVGHPYFDELVRQQLNLKFVSDERAKPGRIVALLPGSRNQEVTANFQMMLASAAKIHQSRPETRFLVAAFNERHVNTIRAMIAASPHQHLPVDVWSGATPEIIELAEACIAVSGSVSLEIMFRAKPTVIVFRMKPLTLWLARRLVKLPYFTLVNLLANQPLFPEFATSGDESGPVSSQVLEWLNNPAARTLAVSRLQELRGRAAVPGACERAAEYLVQQLAAHKKQKTAA